MKINILPFLCEAISLRRKNFKNIDKLYESNKFVFYKFAKESEFYNSSLLSDSDFLTEEYNKKLLGIFIYMSKTSDENIMSDIDILLQDSYPYVCSYIMQYHNIDFEHFTKAYIKKIGINNITDDKLNGAVAVLYFFTANNPEKKLVVNKALETTECMFLGRLKHANKGQYHIRSIFEKLEDTDIKKLQKQLDEIGIYNRQTLMGRYHDNKFVDDLSLIFDFEEISTSLFENIELSRKDLLQIMWLTTEMKQIETDNTKYNINNFIIILYLRYMLKAYKNIKLEYFKNNKETMFVDLEKLQNNLNDVNNEIKIKDNEIKDLKKQIQQLTKDNKRLKKDIYNNKLYKEEVVSLRDSFFRSSMDKIEDPEEKIDYKKLENEEYMIIGGPDFFQLKLKEYLKKSVFITIDNKNFDINIIKNMKMIIIFPNYLNHALYYRIINKARILNKKVKHINCSNVNLILKMIEGGDLND